MAWRVILIETIDWAKEDRIEKSTFKIEHEYSFTSGNCIPVSVNQFIQALMQKGWVLFHCVTHTRKTVLLNSIILQTVKNVLIRTPTGGEIDTM